MILLAYWTGWIVGSTCMAWICVCRYGKGEDGRDAGASAGAAGSPKRNCDRFADADEAYLAFDGACSEDCIEPCGAAGRTCTRADSARCFGRWLFARAGRGDMA